MPGEWQQFLHAIEQDLPVEEVEEEEEKKEDGTTS